MTRTSIGTAVVESIARLTGCSAQEISEANDLIDDLGVDSLIAVKLLAAIEDRLGILLPEGCEASLVGISTVGELTDRLTAVLAERAPAVEMPRPVPD